MSILIQPEKSLVIGNKREPNILNLKNEFHEPMKRRVIIILALPLSKFINMSRLEEELSHLA